MEDLLSPVLGKASFWTKLILLGLRFLCIFTTQGLYMLLVHCCRIVGKATITLHQLSCLSDREQSSRCLIGHGYWSWSLNRPFICSDVISQKPRSVIRTHISPVVSIFWQIYCFVMLSHRDKVRLDQLVIYSTWSNCHEINWKVYRKDPRAFQYFRIRYHCLGYVKKMCSAVLGAVATC